MEWLITTNHIIELSSIRLVEKKTIESKVFKTKYLLNLIYQDKMHSLEFEEKYERDETFNKIRLALTGEE